MVQTRLRRWAPLLMKPVFHIFKLITSCFISSFSHVTGGSSSDATSAFCPHAHPPRIHGNHGRYGYQFEHASRHSPAIRFLNGFISRYARLLTHDYLAGLWRLTTPLGTGGNSATCLLTGLLLRRFHLYFRYHRLFLADMAWMVCRRIFRHASTTAPDSSHQFSEGTAFKTWARTAL